jgi:glycosyltransferase involved in cell wall biosynthesis
MNAIRQVLRSLRTTVDLVRARTGSADLAVFHDFMPAPYGGGHQFLRALCKDFVRRGFVLENNRIAAGTSACLYNAFNFDFDRLRRFARAGCRMVHRVDGPVGVYRGADDGTDRRIWNINHDLADATIFQSQYSLDRHQEMGLAFVNPAVIHNAADPDVFHATGRAPFSRARRTRVVAVSWSDNPNKGAATYAWLESHLDCQRFEITFVGRSRIAFERIRTIPPIPSIELAALLREHDIFITASRHESCSNSLVEALSCGLPSIYVESGSNAELVGDAGFGFTADEQIPGLLDRLVREFDLRQQAIRAPVLSDVANRYLDVLGLPRALAASERTKRSERTKKPEETV